MKWQCAKCGEVHDGYFDSCWKCGAAKPKAQDLVARPRRNRRVLLVTSERYPGADESAIIVVGLVSSEALVQRQSGDMQSPAGDKLSQARDKVLKDIQQSAENQGADAVIGVRVLYQDTTGGVLVTVSGTAIQLATHSSSDDLPSTTNPDDEQSVVESDPDQVSAEGSNTDDHKRLACPSCGSTNVTSIEVFDRKHPESVKVKSGGCGGCMGCLVVILLVVLLWPVLVAIGIGGGILGALGLRGLDGFIRDNLPLVIGGVVVAIVVTALIKASQPKYVCEKCGNKWK